MLRRAKKKIRPMMSNSKATSTRQGMAPWRGMTDDLAVVDFLLIFGAAIQQWRLGRAGRVAYFLNKLSNAARASFALRGAWIALWSPLRAAVPEGKASRATVTRGENRLHVLF